MTPTTRTANLIAGTALVLVLAACGSDDPSSSDSPPPATSAAHTTHAGSEAPTVVVNGIDYAFQNVPTTVAAGTKLQFVNTSDVELHELVAFRVDTDEPLEELLALPQADLEQLLGAPATVLVHPPGAPEGFAALGDGTLTEPGRYILLCTIPVGADPDEYLAAAQAAGGGRPDGFDGPPHFATGMAAELTVE